MENKKTLSFYITFAYGFGLSYINLIHLFSTMMVSVFGFAFWDRKLSL